MQVSCIQTVISEKTRSEYPLIYFNFISLLFDLDEVKLLLIHGRSTSFAPAPKPSLAFLPESLSPSVRINNLAC
jgi:hypothetical protein